MATPDDNRMTRIRAQIKEFPQDPGVYLMKDADARVLYIGKAKSLRERVSSYFQPGADLLQSRGPRIVEMVEKVIDVSFLECENDVDAILQEARLIKDIQPPYNSRQTDDKTFPYLEITTADDFPLIRLTRAPQHRGSKLYGPFTNPRDLRRVIQVLQRVFKFRTCGLEIKPEDDKRRFFRPCILYDIQQCTGPCGDRISRQAYRDDIKRFQRFLESKRSVVLRQMRHEMSECAEKHQFEQAARLRDEIKAIESLDDRGEVDEHVQPELFQIDPTEGIERLTELLDMPGPPRVIEGVDIAHIQGVAAVGALVCFIDGRPFKNRYRRFRIKETTGIDDYAMIQEVLRRRYRRASIDEEIFPDMILIDGGIGQLHAAQQAFDEMPVRPGMVVSLAKQNEELFVQHRAEPLRLARNDPALRLVQYVRDEAHRFAQHYFHILKQRQTFD